MLRNFFGREEGQSLVEYVLILVLIAIVVIGILTLLNRQAPTINDSLPTTATPAP